MNKKEKIAAVTGSILGLILGASLALATSPVSAHITHCDECHTSTPHPSPTPHECWKDCRTPVPTDSPTASPSATPEETDQPTPTENPNDSLTVAGAPQLDQCQVMVAPTILTFNRPAPNSVHITWSETGNVSDYVVFYGLDEHNLPWNTTVKNSHEVTLNSVPNENIWVSVAANDGTCTGPHSLVIDP